jgi:hypothetical protein
MFKFVKPNPRRTQHNDFIRNSYRSGTQTINEKNSNEFVPVKRDGTNDLFGLRNNFIAPPIAPRQHLEMREPSEVEAGFEAVVKKQITVDTPDDRDTHWLNEKARLERQGRHDTLPFGREQKITQKKISLGSEIFKIATTGAQLKAQVAAINGIMGRGSIDTRRAILKSGIANVKLLKLLNNNINKLRESIPVMTRETKDGFADVDSGIADLKTSVDGKAPPIDIRQNLDHINKGMAAISRAIAAQPQPVPVDLTPITNALATLEAKVSAGQAVGRVSAAASATGLDEARRAFQENKQEHAKMALMITEVIQQNEKLQALSTQEVRTLIKQLKTIPAPITWQTAGFPRRFYSRQQYELEKSKIDMFMLMRVNTGGRFNPLAPIPQFEGLDLKESKSLPINRLSHELSIPRPSESKYAAQIKYIDLEKNAVVSLTYAVQQVLTGIDRGQLNGYNVPHERRGPYVLPMGIANPHFAEGDSSKTSARTPWLEHDMSSLGILFDKNTGLKEYLIRQVSDGQLTGRTRAEIAHASRHPPGLQ